MLKEARQRIGNSADYDSDSGTVVTNHHVDPQQFFELALSTRKLVRDDRSSAGLRGLLDPETGHRFVVEEDKLFDALGHV